MPQLQQRSTVVSGVHLTFCHKWVALKGDIQPIWPIPYLRPLTKYLCGIWPEMDRTVVSFSYWKCVLKTIYMKQLSLNNFIRKDQLTTLVASLVRHCCKILKIHFCFCSCFCLCSVIWCKLKESDVMYVAEIWISGLIFKCMTLVWSFHKYLLVEVIDTLCSFS